MNENKENFTYTYSAPTQEERKTIEAIRNKYQPNEKKNDGELARLRYLDGRVEKIPTAIALSLGVIGTLVFGTGLACILEWSLYLLGGIVSAIGILPVALAYPVHQRTRAALKKKHGEEILALTERLLSGSENETHGL